MPILFQKIIKREDVRRNGDCLYVFGDNVLRRGHGGQAGEMRGEPNAVGVATKNYPGVRDDDFFGEDPAQVLAQKAIINNDLKRVVTHLAKGGIVIWPTDGIGTGLSELPTRAPTTFDYLESKLAALLQISELFKTGRNVALQRKIAEQE